MLNFRLLYILLNPRPIRIYLGLTACLGFAVLADILIFLNLSLLVGLWITMAILAFLSAACVVAVYRLVDHRSRQVVAAVDDGHFDREGFAQYLSTLIAGALLIIPGIANTFVGVVFLLPRVGFRVGEWLACIAGIDWQEAYEFLRFERLADMNRRNQAEG